MYMMNLDNYRCSSYNKNNNLESTAMRKTISGAALTAVLLMSGAQISTANELKIAHFMPPMHPMDQSVMTPLAEDISVATNGELTMRIYPSGELGKGPVQQYKRVLTGVADIVFGIPGYTAKQFGKTTMLHIPGLFTDGADATNTVWDNIGLLEGEFSKAKLLGLWANNPSVLITRDKAVRTIADIKGLKIRTPNPVMTELLKAWGAIPVSMPTTETYNSMNTGVVDGVMIGPSGIRSYKLYETAKYITTNIPSALDSFYLFMNKSSWDDLSEDHKTKLDKLTGRTLSLQGAKAFYDAGQEGFKLAQEHSVELIKIDATADLQFRTAMKLPLKAYINKTGKDNNVDAQAIVTALGGE